MIVGRTHLTRYDYLKKIILVSAALLILDISMGALAGLGWLNNVWYFADKSSFRVASDLAFIEGAVVFSAGSFIAFFSLHLNIREKSLIAVGAVLVGISLALGVFS
jgi:hypothetical protein